jgi:hypothetical protein
LQGFLRFNSGPEHKVGQKITYVQYVIVSLFI